MHVHVCPHMPRCLRRVVSPAVKWLTDVWNKGGCSRSPAVISHANVFQTQVLLNLPVWLLSTTGNESSFNAKSIIPHSATSLIRLKWFHSNIKCWCQACRPENSTPSPFSHSGWSFSRIWCAISLTCDHLASRVTWTALHPQGIDLLHGALLWMNEVTWTLHVGHMVPGHLLFWFSSARSHNRLHRWRGVRLKADFSAGSEWSQGFCGMMLLGESLLSPESIWWYGLCHTGQVKDQNKLSSTVQI